jgi:uncharacterized protein
MYVSEAMGLKMAKNLSKSRATEPYATRASSPHTSGPWTGSSVLRVGGVRPGGAPPWRTATTFTAACIEAVSKALGAAC